MDCAGRAQRRRRFRTHHDSGNSHAGRTLKAVSRYACHRTAMSNVNFAKRVVNASFLFLKSFSSFPFPPVPEFENVIFAAR